MGALTKALSQSKALVTSAHTAAMRMKGDGTLQQALSTPATTGILGSLQSESRTREQYGRFHGWQYSAINTIATEGASQSVNVAQLVNAPTQDQQQEQQQKRRMRVKSFLLQSMTKSIHSKVTKAVHREMKLLEDHPLLATLEKPNDMQNRWEFVYTFIANLYLTGWGYVVADEDEDGQLELYALPTSWIKPDHSKGLFKEFRVIDPRKPAANQAEAPPLDRTQVAFAHFPNPSDPRVALAPSMTQISAIRIDDHIQASREQFFSNGVFPSVVITVGKDPVGDGGGVRRRLTGPQRRQIHAAIAKMWQGVQNYGVPAIIDGLIERIDPLSARANEMGWEMSEKQNKDRLLSAYGVHEYILGTSVSVGGYAQVYSIEKRFAKRVNVPLDMLSNMMTNFLGTKQQDPSLLVWWDKIEPQDESIKWQNLRYARQNDDISQNEWRALLGMPPDEDRNESSLSNRALAAVVQLAAQVGAGAIKPEQAAAMLRASGLSDEHAEAIAGVGLEFGPPPGSEGAPSPNQGAPAGAEALQAAVNTLRKKPKELVDQILEELG